MLTLKENREFDALALGEILLRLSAPSNERIVRGDTFEKCAGGAELNVVSGISMMGLRTGIISKVPKNDIGTYIKNHIRFCGVSDDCLIYDDSKDARLGIYFYENGAYPRKSSVVYDRRHTSITKITIDDIPESTFSSTRLFHTTGITLALSPETRAVTIESPSTLISEQIFGMKLPQNNTSKRFFHIQISFSYQKKPLAELLEKQVLYKT